MTNKTRNCKLCGQPLASSDAVWHVRNHGASSRRLHPKTRAALRRAILAREKARLNDPQNKPTMEMLAERYGCSRRTVIRERDWMVIEGALPNEGGE